MIIILVGLIIYDALFYDDKRQIHRKKDSFKWKDLNPFSDVLDMLKFSDLRRITAMGFLANFTLPLMVLVLPYYIINILGLNNTHLSIAIFLMAASHSLQFLMGDVAEKIGERKSMIIGLSLSGIFFMSLFFANSFELFLVFLFLRGVGAGLWNVSAGSFMSIIAEKHNIEGKVIGSYAAISRIAITISFAVSGLILVSLGTKMFILYGALLILPVLLFGHRILHPSIQKLKA